MRRWISKGTICASSLIITYLRLRIISVFEYFSSRFSARAQHKQQLNIAVQISSCSLKFGLPEAFAIAEIENADRSGRMNCLRSLERWDHGFKSHSRHGCLCVRLFCVCV
jgi:hypothetical protein